MAFKISGYVSFILLLIGILFGYYAVGVPRYSGQGRIGILAIGFLITYKKGQHMNEISVKSVGLVGGKYVQIQLPGPYVCGLTDEAAILLAAKLVFMAAGYMVKSAENNKLTEWNLEHPFFMEYKKLMGLT